MLVVYGVSKVHWGLAGSVGIRGPEGYKCIKGTFGASRGVGGIEGPLMGVKGCQGVGVKGVLGDWQGV